jgi:hypothetical protein
MMLALYGYGMVFAGSKTEARLLFIVTVLITLCIIYGFMTRPVIAYHISTSLEYNGTMDFNAGDLEVSLETTNRGLSPARVELTVRLYNISLTGPQDSEVSERDQFSELQIRLDEPIPPSGHDVRTITFTTVEDADYMVLIFYADPQPRYDPITGFFDSFALYKPERPTALLLKQVGAEEYKRVTSR